MFFACLALQNFILTYINVGSEVKSVLYVYPHLMYARQSVTGSLTVPEPVANQKDGYACIFLQARSNTSVSVESTVTLQTSVQTQFASFFDMGEKATVQQTMIKITLNGQRESNVAGISHISKTLTLRATNVTLVQQGTSLAELYGISKETTTSLAIISCVVKVESPTNPISTQLAGLTNKTATLSVKGTTLTIGSARSPKAMGLCMKATGIDVVNATITAVLNQQYDAATHVSGLFSTVGTLVIKGSSVTLTVNASEQYGGLGNTVSTSASITGSTLTIALSVGQKCIHVGALFKTTEGATITLDQNTLNLSGYYTSDCTITGECQNNNPTVTTIELNDGNFTQSVNYSIQQHTREFKHAIQNTINANNTKIIFTALNFPINISFSPFNNRPLYSNILVQTNNQLNINSGGNYPFYGTIAPFLTTETCMIKVQDNTNFNFSDSHVGGIIAAIYNTKQKPITIVNCTMANTQNGREMSSITHQIDASSYVSISNCTCSGTATASSHSAVIVRTTANVTLTVTNLIFTGQITGTNNGNVGIIGDISGTGTVTFNGLVSSGTITRANAAVSGVVYNIVNGATLNLVDSEISATVTSTSGIASGVVGTANGGSNIIIQNTAIGGRITSTNGRATGVIGVANNGANLNITGGTVSVTVTGGSDQRVAGIVNRPDSDTTNDNSIILTGIELSITVTGGSNTGGIVTSIKQSLTLDNIRGTITVNGAGQNAGGVSSLLYSRGLIRIQNSNFSTTVKNNNHNTGGVIGSIWEHTQVVIENVTLSTNVNTTGNHAGGVVGESYSLNVSHTVTNSNITTTVSGQKSQGGYIAYQNAGSNQPQNARMTLDMTNVRIYFTGNGQIAFGTGAVIGWSQGQISGTQTDVIVNVSGIYGGCPSGAASPYQLEKTGFTCNRRSMTRVELNSFQESDILYTDYTDQNVANNLIVKDADYNYTEFVVSGDINLNKNSQVNFGEFPTSFTVFQDIIYSGSRDITKAYRGGCLISSVRSTTYIFNVTVTAQFLHKGGSDFHFVGLFERARAAVYVGNYTCKFTFNVLNSSIQPRIASCGQDLFNTLNVYNVWFNPTTNTTDKNKVYPLMTWYSDNATCKYYNVNNQYTENEYKQNFGKTGKAADLTCTQQTDIP